MTPIKTLKKIKEKVVISILKDKRERNRAKSNLGDLVRRADIKKTFSKSDSTKWSYILYTITKVRHDTNPSYRINYLPEREIDDILGPTKLALAENNQKIKNHIYFNKNNDNKWNKPKMKNLKSMLDKVCLVYVNISYLLNTNRTSITSGYNVEKKDRQHTKNH